jgi:putative tryptophan/tyrosine transport system substrate-binding protein
MRRRELISLLGGAVVSWPLTARAQQPDRMRRVGVLFATGESDPDTPARIAAMRHELQSLGWSEGKNLRIDVRYGDGNTKVIQDRAIQLVNSNPDVILILGTVVASAVQKVSRSIPVVFTQVSDPVQAGIVSSLAHPVGNITGFTTYEYSMIGKWLEILKEISPSTSRVLLLLNPENVPQWTGYTRFFEPLAEGRGIEFVPGAVRNSDEIERRIEAFSRKQDGGLIVPPDAVTAVHLQLIIDLSVRHRVPAVYPYRNWAASGGLLSYGIDVVDQFRQASRYVGRILKGEKPADLPIQAPTEFKIVINLKTAKALGLAVPPSLLARADEVIE